MRELVEGVLDKDLVEFWQANAENIDRTEWFFFIQSLRNQKHLMDTLGSIDERLYWLNQGM